MKLSTKLFLIGIILLAAAFRLYDINWDQGFHMHPDERAIVLAVNNLSFPLSISSFFSIGSPWNPHFFAYGSFPFYLLRIIGDVMSRFDPLLGTYDKINLVGRVISAFADLATIIVVFFLGKKLLSPALGLAAAFFYAISTLSIQLSHFYAVDTLLTFFCIGTLYYLLLFYEKPTERRALAIGIFLGLALATKISAFVLVVAIGGALTADFLLILLKKPHRIDHWLPHLTPFMKHLLLHGVIIALTTALVVAITEPYLMIDFSEFTNQTQQQSQMTRDAFTFPYTLQYVGKIPYLYEIKNIFFFGLGPFQAMISFGGVLYACYLAYKKHSQRIAKETILLAFFLPYFIVVGRFSVGFMRYMLPLYPLFAIFGALIIDRIFVLLFKTQLKYRTLGYCIGAACLLIWPISFMHIYMEPNTRVSASVWITDHIPPGSTIATEHWDDLLPLFGQANYHFLTLALYDPDTAGKWDTINKELSQSDYIIIASNRLYTPLQKLTDCAHLPLGRCYPTTARYYQDLFADKKGFQEIAEFTDYPTLPFLNVQLNDQWADESFTVYDHPKVMIFKKIANGS